MVSIASRATFKFLNARGVQKRFFPTTYTVCM